MIIGVYLKFDENTRFFFYIITLYIITINLKDIKAITNKIETSVENLLNLKPKLFEYNFSFLYLFLIIGCIIDTKFSFLIF